jgi:hypothetical protein
MQDPFGKLKNLIPCLLDDKHRAAEHVFVLMFRLQEAIQKL